MFGTLLNEMQSNNKSWLLIAYSLSNLKIPLDEAINNTAVVRDLTWYLQKAELDYLFHDLRQICIEALRHKLTANGLGDPGQRIAFIPCGRLGILPVHAAWVGQDRH